MKKIKFLSGINAMFALAAVALATTFTSCEKEELSFNLKPQVATLTIDATVVVIEDGKTVETKSFTKSETSQPGASIPAGSFAVSHSYTFKDGKEVPLKESVTYPTVLPGQNVALTPTFIISHNNVFPEQEYQTVEVTSDGTPGSEDTTGYFTNESNYYAESTDVKYSFNKGIQVVDSKVLPAATYEESYYIENYVKSINTFEELTDIYQTSTVYSMTKVVVTVTQNYVDSTITFYRKAVEGSTRAEDVEIGWCKIRNWGDHNVTSESFNLSDDKPGHGHGHNHGHGHGAENAGGGIIWE